MGAPNVAAFVPPNSVVQLRDFGGSVKALADHLRSLLDEPQKYLEKLAWKRSPLPDAFHARFGFVATHAKCRLCRWAYARKFGLEWMRAEQQPRLPLPREHDGPG